MFEHQVIEICAALKFGVGDAMLVVGQCRHDHLAALTLAIDLT